MGDPCEGVQNRHHSFVRYSTVQLITKTQKLNTLSVGAKVSNISKNTSKLYLGRFYRTSSIT